MVAIAEEYSQVGERVMKTVPNLRHLLTDDVRICFMKSDKKKTSNKKVVQAECVKTQEMYSAFCPYDFFVIVYEPNIEGFSDRQLEILIEHELLHVGVEKDVDGNTKYSVRPHDYDDFRQITEKYGVDWAQPKDA